MYRRTLELGEDRFSCNNGNRQTSSLQVSTLLSSNRDTFWRYTYELTSRGKEVGCSLSMSATLHQGMLESSSFVPRPVISTTIACARTNSSLSLTSLLGVEPRLVTMAPSEVYSSVTDCNMAAEMGLAYCTQISAAQQWQSCSSLPDHNSAFNSTASR